MALQDVKTRFFQLWIVVVVDDVETDDLAAGRQQALRDVKADEAGGPVTRIASCDICLSGSHSQPPQLNAVGLGAPIELHFDIENETGAVG